MDNMFVSLKKMLENVQLTLTNSRLTKDPPVEIGYTYNSDEDVLLIEATYFIVDSEGNSEMVIGECTLNCEPLEWFTSTQLLNYIAYQIALSVELKIKELQSNGFSVTIH